MSVFHDIPKKVENWYALYKHEMQKKAKQKKHIKTLKTQYSL